MMDNEQKIKVLRDEMVEQGAAISHRLKDGEISLEDAKELRLELRKEYHTKVVATPQQPKKKPCGCGKKNKTKKPTLWSRFNFFVRGMIGMFGYATRISKRTSEDHVKARQRICESCPIYDFGICNKDRGGCGCVLYAKIRVEKEKCPKGKWGPVEAKAK